MPLHPLLPNIFPESTQTFFVISFASLAHPLKARCYIVIVKDCDVDSNSVAVMDRTGICLELVTLESMPGDTA